MPKDYIFNPKSNALSREDYRPAEYSITHTDLHFDLDKQDTKVKSKLTIKANDKSAAKGGPLILDGVDLLLKSVKINGVELDRADFYVTKTELIIKRPPTGEFTLEIENNINPEENTALEGLYASGDLLSTQCEAQGFRRITYFLDRPDTLSTFDVTLEADKQDYPILLSNGNGSHKDTKDLGNGRHQTSWQDPWPKPAYLFAIVGGKLNVLEDSFTTRSGKKVDLRIFVEDGYEDKVAWAMESVKRSMKWDEDKYDREYDLDLFQIVAVKSFNMGAMENKGLNIFNISLLAGDAETSTDARLTAIEAVIGHEYFHNYSGNRVTVRDWFELTLKEGLTVLRDREFTKDMHSNAIQVIKDADELRIGQFASDSGPNAHPIRPEDVAEFDNIYTSTIYTKGSHVLDMVKTMIGDDVWKDAMNVYFDRFDGQAVTCDDFVNTMEEVSGLDLTQFRKWYSQSGTPEIEYATEYDKNSKIYKLTIYQNNPATADQLESEKEPLHMPIKFGLINSAGNDIPLTLKGEAANNAENTKVLHIKDSVQVFEFTDINDENVVPSLLRGFSAPVKIKTEISQEELSFRMMHDSDGFNKYEAGQKYAMKIILDLIEDFQAGKDLELPTPFKQAYSNLIASATDGDRAFSALALSLPSISLINQELDVIDPDAVKAVTKFIKQDLYASNKADFDRIYADTTADRSQEFDMSPKQVGNRSLHNTALSFINADENIAGLKIAKTQYDDATNMTEKLAGLATLTHSKSVDKDSALEDFYNRYGDNQNILTDWFMLQTSADRDDALDVVKKLMEHPKFDITSPNILRSVMGGYMSNSTQFHKKNGEGYKFLSEMVIKLNTINPAIGAGLVAGLTNWRKYDETRGSLMKAELEKIMKTPELAKGIKELVGKALKPLPEEELKSGNAVNFNRTAP